MNSKFFSCTLTAILINGMFTSFSLATDLDLSYDASSDGTPITALTQADWVQLRNVATDALDNSPDGSTHPWFNNNTGNSGAITILSTDKTANSLCRNSKFIISADGDTSSTIVNVCKQKNGKWSAENNRLDTTNYDKATFESMGENKSSIMFTDPKSEDVPILKETISQTSEYCRKLAQEIDNLKNKPIRRSAAMELHKAECQK